MSPVHGIFELLNYAILDRQQVGGLGGVNPALVFGCFTRKNMAARDPRNNHGDDSPGGGWMVVRGASYYDWRYIAGRRGCAALAAYADFCRIYSSAPY